MHRGEIDKLTDFSDSLVDVGVEATMRRIEDE